MRYRSSYYKFITSLVLSICLLFVLIVQSIVISSFINRNTNQNIKINFNDGNRLFSQEDFQIEPEEEVSAHFFIENKHNAPIYYRIYLENLKGNILTKLQVNIYLDGVDILCIPMIDMQKENMAQPLGTLNAKERKNFVFSIFYQKTGDNSEQGGYVEFDIKVDSMRIDENPDWSI